MTLERDIHSKLFKRLTEIDVHHLLLLDLPHSLLLASVLLAVVFAVFFPLSPIESRRNLSA